MAGSLTWETRSEAIERALLKYDAQGLLVEPSAGWGGLEPVHHILDVAVRVLNERHGMTLQGVRINEAPPRDDFINIYFVADDPSNSFPAARGNCVYVGLRNTIICDHGFVRSLQRGEAALQLPELPDHLVQELGGATAADIAYSRMANVLYWVLLHEIGHMAHGPARTPAGLSAGVVVAADLDYSGAERFADEFVIEVARETDPETRHAFGVLINSGLNSFIQRELAAEARKQGLDGQPVTGRRLKLPMRAGSSHPPLLVRAMRTNAALVEALAIEDPKWTLRWLQVIEIEVIP